MEYRSTHARIVTISDKVGHTVEKVTGAYCVFLFAAMVVIALLGVFFRYIMHSPFQWTEELARYLLVWMAFVAINIALRRKEHINIPFLTQHVPPAVAKAMDYLVDLLVFFFLIVLLKQGYFMTTRTILMTSTLHISMFWIYMSVPVAALLTLVQLIVNVLKKTFSGFEMTQGGSL